MSRSSSRPVLSRRVPWSHPAGNGANEGGRSSSYSQWNSSPSPASPLSHKLPTIHPQATTHHTQPQKLKHQQQHAYYQHQSTPPRSSRESALSGLASSRHQEGRSSSPNLVRRGVSPFDDGGVQTRSRATWNRVTPEPILQQQQNGVTYSVGPGARVRKDASLSPARPKAVAPRVLEDTRPLGPGVANGGIPDDVPSETEPKVKCGSCGRSFFESRLKKHANVCERSKAKAAGKKKRGVFNVSAARVAGTDAAKFNPDVTASITDLRNPGRTSVAGGKSKQPPKKNDPNKVPKWKAQHLALKASLRAARGEAVEKPPEWEDPNIVKCPNCARTFNPEAADRHIPICSKVGFSSGNSKSSSSTAKPRTRVSAPAAMKRPSKPANSRPPISSSNKPQPSSQTRQQRQQPKPATKPSSNSSNAMSASSQQQPVKQGSSGPKLAASARRSLSSFKSTGYAQVKSSGYGNVKSSGYGGAKSSGYGAVRSSGYGASKSSGYGQARSKSTGAAAAAAKSPSGGNGSAGTIESRRRSARSAAPRLSAPPTTRVKIVSSTRADKTKSGRKSAIPVSPVRRVGTGSTRRHSMGSIDWTKLTDQGVGDGLKRLPGSLLPAPGFLVTKTSASAPGKTPSSSDLSHKLGNDGELTPKPTIRVKVSRKAVSRLT